jgi:hypothetical protein
VRRRVGRQIACGQEAIEEPVPELACPMWVIRV